MAEHDARTLPAAALAMVACAVAATTGRWALLALMLGASALAGSAVAALLTARSRGPRGVPWRRWRDAATSVAVALAVAALLTGAGAVRAHAALPADVREAAAHGAPVTVWGTVVGEPRDAGRDPWTGMARWAVRVRVDAACVSPDPGEPCPVREAASALVDAIVGEGAGAPGAADQVGAGRGAPPGLGARVEATGRASASRDPRVALALWDARVVASGGHDPLLRAIAAARDRTRENAAGVHDEVRGLALGMVLGDTTDMPGDLVEQMRVTGLTHLTAVSGSHFAIVLLAWGAALRRWVRSRVVRAALLAVGMAALAALVGPEPSVQRALTMALAVAAGVAWGRPARALPALGAGVIAVLVIEPALAASAGLQLSAVAVVAIVVWAPRLRDLLARWMLGPLATSISVPAAAWLACWPLLTTLRPGIGIYTVPANLIAGLAAFPVTLVGLGGAVVGLAWPAAGAALLQLAGWCSWPVVWAARGFARAPHAWLPWPPSAGGAALAALAVCVLVLGTMARRWRAALRLSVALAGAVIAIATPVLEARSTSVPSNAAVVVCDVGQGDMMIVPLGAGEAIVVDTGPPGGEGAACLARYGVRHVPLLVLTHPHADHDGAVAELAAVASIDAAWVSPAALGEGHDGGARDAAAAGIAVRAPPVGAVFESGTVTVRVWGPPPQRGVASSSSEINDASLSLWIDTRGVTALALGDLETRGQDDLARALGGPVVVDLVKVAHHGSREQSPGLAALITARVAAISVGADNSYGHPDPATLTLYEARATAVLATSLCGDIAITAEHRVFANCAPARPG